MNFKKILAASVVLTLAAPQPYYDMILEGNARVLFVEKASSQK